MVKNMEKIKKMVKKNNKKKINICIALSDIHFGHENCIYETFHFCVNKLIEKIEKLKNKYKINEIFLILNGDIVSGTFVYRNQYLESQVQKNESIVLAGAYLIHKIIKKIEEISKIPVKIFVTIGTHEGWYKPHPENFALGISRRLCSYGHNCRYTSNYLILNIAHGLGTGNRDMYCSHLIEQGYNVCAFHSWGGADYSSASPSVIRELTRAHSQLATYRNIIIQRFLLSHTHWLEIDRSVLGIRFDVSGGFQKWDKTVSNRESGLLYYVIDEEGNFKVRKISGLEKQLEEEKGQNLHGKNMRYVTDLINDGIKYEISIGLLKEPVEGLELK